MLVEIPGTPIALKRPRMGQGKVFDSQTRDKAVARILLRSAAFKCVSCFCAVKLTFCFSSRDPLELWGIERPTRSDIDNLAKFTLDIGNGILWEDDRLIIKLECIKKYSKKAKTIIEITPVDIMKKSHEKLFSVMSPEDVAEFRQDFMTFCTDWSMQDLIESSETEDYSNLSKVASRLLNLSKKWYEKFKKINSIKDD